MRTFSIGQMHNIIGRIIVCRPGQNLVRQFGAVVPGDLFAAIESVRLKTVRQEEAQQRNKRRLKLMAIPFAVIAVVIVSLIIMRQIPPWWLAAPLLIIFWVVPCLTEFEISVGNPGAGDGIALDFAAYVKRAAKRLNLDPDVIVKTDISEQDCRKAGIDLCVVAQEVCDEMKTGECPQYGCSSHCGNGCADCCHAE